MGACVPFLMHEGGGTPFCRRRCPVPSYFAWLQVSAAAEPSLLDAWEADAGEADNGEGEDEGGTALTAAAFKAKCSCWWEPRQPPLGGELQPATFEVEVRCRRLVGREGGCKEWCTIPQPPSAQPPAAHP